MPAARRRSTRRGESAVAACSFERRRIRRRRSRRLRIARQVQHRQRHHALGPGTNNHYGLGGGLAMPSGNYALIQNSTIDHNLADAGAAVALAGASGSAVIEDSTISSNVANVTQAGISAGMSVSIFSSTIAFNSAGPFGNGGLY